MEDGDVSSIGAVDVNCRVRKLTEIHDRECMMKMRIPLRAVFYLDGGHWVAHCLEFDLMGHGETRQEALSMLSEAIAIQIEATVRHQNPANLFSPADGRIFAMFAAGKDVAFAKLEIEKRPVASVTIEDVETREYSASDAELALA
jgi:predicted RNase H-like HicB family nuclease